MGSAVYFDLQPGAFRKPAMFGVPGDYLVGDSCMFRIVLSTDESNKKIEVPEAREAIDLHLPKEGAKTIKQNFKRQTGWMELVSKMRLTRLNPKHTPIKFRIFSVRLYENCCRFSIRSK